MKVNQSISRQAYLALISILGWFALIAQFYLHINSGVAPALELTVRYFSYFTILINLMVAICCTILLIRPGTKLGMFFNNPKTVTAIAVYISVVGITYNVILRSIWDPQGLQKLVDNLLHSVIPVLFLFFWLLFANKNKLKWTDGMPWLLCPLIYLVVVLIRGAFSGFYPYPFIDLSKLGWERALINSLGVTGLFVVVSLLFIGIGNILAGKVK